MLRKWGSKFMKAVDYVMDFVAYSGGFFFGVILYYSIYSYIVS